MTTGSMETPNNSFLPSGINDLGNGNIEFNGKKYPSALLCNQSKDSVLWGEHAELKKAWILEAPIADLLKYERGEYSVFFTGIDTISHKELVEFVYNKLLEYILGKNSDINNRYQSANPKYSLIFVRSDTDRKGELTVRVADQKFFYLIDENGNAEHLSEDHRVADLATQNLLLKTLMGVTTQNVSNKLP